MNHNILRFLFIAILSNIINPPGMCQTEMPDVLKTGKLTEQLNYIEERTRIYEYYRAVREDMWQQIKKNTLDTLALAKGEISILTRSENKFNTKIDSLNKLVNEASIKLDEAVRTKNNIKVLGFDINKIAYNSVMWIIMASLAAILALGFLIFKRNMAVTRNTKKDLEELKTEFETYRKQSREAREKMSKDHFNEVRRLRANVSSGASAKEESGEQRAESGKQRAESGERGAEIEERSLTNEERKSRKAGNEIPGSGNGDLRAKNEEAHVQNSEVSGEGEVQTDQTDQVLQNLSENAVATGETVPKLQSEAKKSRRRKTQNPGQGSIEL